MTTSPRTAGLALVVLGVGTTVLGVALPWTRAGELHADLYTISGVLFLGPVLSVLRLIHGRLDRRHVTASAVAAGIGALLCAGIAGTTLRLVPPADGAALGGPITVVGALATAIGWALVAIAGTGPLVTRRQLPLAAGVVALSAALGASAVIWYVDGRIVRSDTVSAIAGTRLDVAPTGPRWQVARDAGTPIGFAGAHLVVSDPSGVQAYAASSGERTWSYRRLDVPLVAAGLAGQTLVAVYRTSEGLLITGRSTATGQERFMRRYITRDWRPDRVLSTSDGTLAVLHGRGPNPGDVVAIQPQTGQVRWTWRPERDGGTCDVSGIAAIGTTLAVAQRCRAAGVRDIVTGLSTVDGTPRWEWSTPYTDQAPRGPELAIAAAGTRFLVWSSTGPRRATALGVDDGAAGATHPAAGEVFSIAGSRIIYLTGGAAGARLTSVDVETAAVGWVRDVAFLAGWQSVAAATANNRTYLLMRIEGVTLRVIGVDSASGADVGDARLHCQVTCAEAGIVAGETGVVVTAQLAGRASTTLTALS